MNGQTQDNELENRLGKTPWDPVGKEYIPCLDICPPCQWPPGNQGVWSPISAVGLAKHGTGGQG